MTRDSTPTAGIDAARDKLDVAIAGPGEHFTLANTPAGWRPLAERLGAAGVKRVGIEASGGYERGVVEHLRRAGFTVLLPQPLPVKAWAKVQRRRPKNDRIDAALIAACAALIEPPAGEPSPRPAALADHLTFIAQIEEDIARLKIRLEQPRPTRLRRRAAGEIARLQRRREAELRRLLGALERHADLKTRFDLVLSIPGIGGRTALAIPIRLPELGTLSREQAAAPAGDARSTPPSCPPPFAGTPPLSPSAAASRRAANPTNPPSSPAPENCSSMPTPSPPAAPPGRHIQPQVNSCYRASGWMIAARHSKTPAWPA